MSTSPIHPKIWSAIAGITSSSPVPAVGSLVYYFPRGHFEHLHGNAQVPAEMPSYFLCRIVRVTLHASSVNDDVFSRILLDPLYLNQGESSSNPNPGASNSIGGGKVLVGESSSSNSGDSFEISSFVKVLTTSDANNGGGFSVPRYCAQAILPPLDMNEETPLQVLRMKDAHGSNWEFRHIFRGTPKRHLLTTGWSKFVNSKKLISGDSVVFIRDNDGELHLGIRRAISSNNNINPSGGEFVRNFGGKVGAESVFECVRNAAEGRRFEVEYYPTSRMPEFVVRREAVESSMSVEWSVGIKVKMKTQLDEREVTFTGSVVRVDTQNWPWRGIQVAWNEAEASHNITNVSSWQVELDSGDSHVRTMPTDTAELKSSRPSEYPHQYPHHQTTNLNIEFKSPPHESPTLQFLSCGMNNAEIEEENLKPIQTFCSTDDTSNSIQGARQNCIITSNVDNNHTHLTVDSSTSKDKLTRQSFILFGQIIEFKQDES